MASFCYSDLNLLILSKIDSLCMHTKLLSRVRLSATLWTVPTRLLCPWDSPGKNTGVGAMPSSRGSSQPKDQICISYFSCVGRWILYLLSPVFYWSSQVVLVEKNQPANAGDIGDVGSIPGSGRSPGEEHGTHSSILAWRIPWTEESGGLQSMGLQRVGHE